MVELVVEGGGKFYFQMNLFWCLSSIGIFLLQINRWIPD